MILTLTLALAAQAAPEAAQSPWHITRFHRIHLRNGAFIDGDLVENGSSRVVLKIKAGHFGVRRDMIDHVEFVTMKSLKETPRLPDLKKPAAPADPAEGAELAAKPAAPVAPPPANASVRAHVDHLIADWNASKETTPYDLAPRLLALGPDAVAYCCWLVVNRNEQTPVREIIVAVAGTDHPAVFGALEAVSRSGNSDEQQAAVDALEFSGRPAAVDLLMKFLGSPSAQVWRSASEALIRLHRKDLFRDPSVALGKFLEQEAEKAPYAITIARIGEAEGRRVLTDYARYAMPSDRRQAFQGLVLYENPEDADLALPLLNDREAEIRRDACEFLGRLKSGPSCAALIELLEDDNRSVVETAHWALKRISGERFGIEVDLWRRWWEANSARLTAPQNR
jgi:HEAT repeat protein